MRQEKEQLCTQLSDALMYLLVPDQYEKQIQDLKKNEAIFHKNYQGKKDVFRLAQRGIWGTAITTFLLFAVISLAFIFITILIILALIASASMHVSGLIICMIYSALCTFCSAPFVLGVSALFAFIAARSYWNSFKKKHIGEADVYWKDVAAPAVQNIRQKISELESELEGFLVKNRYVLDFIPSDYRDILAIGYMEECVRNLRADSLKEAINLYEEQKHRWTMESLARQMLAETELHNQIMQTGFQAIYDEQRRTTAMATNIRNLTLFNTMRDIHKEVKSS